MLPLQDPKLISKLSKHGTAEQLDQKSLTVCSNVDYTNISYMHLVFPDAQTAKVRRQALFSFAQFVHSSIRFCFEGLAIRTALHHPQHQSLQRLPHDAAHETVRSFASNIEIIQN